MTAQTYLQRKPNARGSTIAHKALVDAKTEQLRREISDMKKQRRRSWLFWIWRRA